MSLKDLNAKSIEALDTLYERLFRQQVEGYWKEACETQEEIQRIEDRVEDHKEPVRKFDVC